VSNLEVLRHLLEDELRELGIKKIRYRTDFKIANSLYFPYLYRAGEYKETFYKVDIESCFYSIYARLGIDCKTIIEFKNSTYEIKAVAKGRLTYQESEIVKILKQDKKLRNAVYGLTRCAFYTQFIPKNTIQRKFFRGKLQNLDLTVIISAFLHNLVKKFRKYIIYWNIDGGIIYPEGYEIMKNYLKEMGFNLRKEAEGEAVILGLGSYKCGEFVTEHFLNGICANIQEKEYILDFQGVEKIEKWLARIERI